MPLCLQPTRTFQARRIKAFWGCRQWGHLIDVMLLANMTNDWSWVFYWILLTISFWHHHRLQLRYTVLTVLCYYSLTVISLVVAQVQVQGLVARSLWNLFIFQVIWCAVCHRPAFFITFGAEGSSDAVNVKANADEDILSPFFLNFAVISRSFMFQGCSSWKWHPAGLLQRPQRPLPVTASLWRRKLLPWQRSTWRGWNGQLVCRSVFLPHLLVWIYALQTQLCVHLCFLGGQWSRCGLQCEHGLYWRTGASHGWCRVSGCIQVRW